MPLYEFHCARCGKPFEELVTGVTSSPVCPVCSKDDQVTRVPFGNVSVGRKEDLRPPFIKGTRPRRQR
jgi:putative FmdB family regulatory protein